jgi:hypothetical protein
MIVPDEGYSYLLTMIVPDEGYSYLLTMIVPDEGYSNQLNLSKPNLLGTNFCVQNRHVFGLYSLN